MAYPKFKPDYKGQSRVKLISKKIKVLKKLYGPKLELVSFLNELNIEIEMIKKDIQIIKNNHLKHIEADMRDVKIEVFRFKYVIYGAIIVFALLSDKADKIFNLI